MVPRTGNTWVIIVDRIVVNRTPVDGGTDGAVVSYSATHRGDAYTSGTLSWDNEDTEIEGAWSERITLPPTPGILRITITVTLGDDTGEAVTSLKVV